MSPSLVALCVRLCFSTEYLLLTQYPQRFVLLLLLLLLICDHLSVFSMTRRK